MNNNSHNAPEVVEGNGADGLIPTHDATTEPLKSVNQYPSYNQQNPSSSRDGHSNSLTYGEHDEKLAGLEAPGGAHADPSIGRRKRWIWITVGLLALAIALGVGLGVGLSRKSRTSNTTENTSEGSISEGTRTTSSTTTTTTSTATPAASAVTSGSTGLAEFSCNSTETTSSSDGTPYIQECFTQYQVGHPSYYSATNNVTMSNLGGKITVYTFQACLDECDERNAAGTEPPCRAVTYYANLTVPVNAWGGNCFLKNDRGNGYQTDPVDYSHTASAYQSCLNSTCSAANA
jgi:hypothetical protein